MMAAFIFVWFKPSTLDETAVLIDTNTWKTLVHTTGMML